MPADFWSPTYHTDRRPFLTARSRIKSALRGWFSEQGFDEVECGQLQVSPGNEVHLHAFEAPWQPEEGGPAVPLFLHTSPEFACKKLLAAGETKIVDFARVFRNGEEGPLHSPEFTMVEWYRTGADLKEVMADTIALARAAARTVDRETLTWKGIACPVNAEPRFLSVSDAFADYAEIDLEPVLGNRDGFARAAVAAGVFVTDTDHWSDIFSKVLVTLIEPNLGHDRLCALHTYPICEAALAKPTHDNPHFADRFELYACGVELANGFAELTDADEQRRRFEGAMAEKKTLYGRDYPLDEDFLRALHRMPDASGVALGFDRLVMLASGARHIRDVLWTPFPVTSK
ncbi:MAG: EF-P lysine aminoacylase EpmA [Parvularcula sp.]